MPYFDKKSQKWRGVVWIGGKRRTRLFRLKSEAKTWEAKEKKRIRDPLPIEPLPEKGDDFGRVTLKSAMGEYLHDCVEKGYHRNVTDHKYRIYKRLLDTIGNPHLCDVTASQIKAFILSQSSPTKINRTREELHALFAYCQEFFGLTQNLAAAVPKSVVEKRKAQYVPTEEEVARLWLDCNRWDRNFLTAFLHTGGRKSEVLRWKFSEDINFEINVVRLVTKRGSTREEVERWIPMSEALRSALEDQWQTRLNTSDYVFQRRSPESENYGDRYGDRKHFVKKLSVSVLGKDKAFGYRGLRRFFSAHLADKHKQSRPALQTLLGHSSKRATEDYIFSFGDDVKEAVAELDELELSDSEGEREGYSPEGKTD